MGQYEAAYLEASWGCEPLLLSSGPARMPSESYASCAGMPCHRRAAPLNVTVTPGLVMNMFSLLVNNSDLARDMAFPATKKSRFQPLTFKAALSGSSTKCSVVWYVACGTPAVSLTSRRSLSDTCNCPTHLFLFQWRDGRQDSVHQVRRVSPQGRPLREWEEVSCCQQTGVPAS